MNGWSWSPLRGWDVDVAHERVCVVRPARGNHTPAYTKRPLNAPNLLYLPAIVRRRKRARWHFLTVTMPGKVGLSRFCRREHCAAGPHPRQPTNKQTIARVTYCSSPILVYPILPCRTRTRSRFRSASDIVAQQVMMISPTEASKTTRKLQASNINLKYTDSMV